MNTECPNSAASMKLCIVDHEIFVNSYLVIFPLLSQYVLVSKLYRPLKSPLSLGIVPIIPKNKMDPALANIRDLASPTELHV